MAAVFPQEILDQILVHVWDNGGYALSACSLTNRGWLYTTRMRRFNSVVVDNEAAYHRFSKLVDSTVGTGAARSVHKLTLGLENPQPFLPESECHALIGTLALLSNVRCLTVAGEAWSLLEGSDTQTLFPALQVLKLRYVELKKPHGLRDFLVHHAECRTVRFFDSEDRTPRQTEGPHQEEEFSCDTLSLKECPYYRRTKSPVLHAILRPPIPLRIRRLEWSCTDWRYHGALLREYLRLLSSQQADRSSFTRTKFAELLWRLGPSLEELSITVYPDAPFHLPVIDTFSLAANVNLKRLELCCPGNKDRVARPWVAALLGKVTHQHTALERITMICKGSVESYVATLDWTSVDETPARLSQTLPNLALAFEIRKVPGGWTEDQVADRIMTLLPRVRAQRNYPTFSLGLLH